MQAKPQHEHEWLQKLVGEWTWEMEGCTAPDKPAEIVTGKESVRSIGGLWTVAEGSMPGPDGGLSATIMTLGYDPAKKKFVGSFIGSMMHNLWVYEGELDEAEKILTLDAEGPSFAEPGKIAKYQDMVEFLNDDHRTLSSRYLGDDGAWHPFMIAHYRRVK